MDGSKEDAVSRKKLVTFGGNEGRDISLREWLDKPDRAVDQSECLHIFRQVVEAVGIAHSQSVVTNIRPSCFVIGSALCSTSASEHSYEEPERAAAAGGGELALEFNWYKSLEEDDGGSNTFASDIYRLGVLLFELFCVSNSLDEKLMTMSNLRHRVLPPQMLLKLPNVASFCLWLLHPQPENRPKIREVLQSDFFNGTRYSLEEQESTRKLRDAIEDQELLLEFLLLLRERKQQTANKLHNTISFFSDDINTVHQKLGGCSYSELNTDGQAAAEGESQPTLNPATNEDLSCTSSRKYLKARHCDYMEELNEGPGSVVDAEVQEKTLSNSSRLMKNFKNLEMAYFSSRSKAMKRTGQLMTIKLPIVKGDRSSNARTDGSATGDLAFKESDSGGGSGWIDPFLDRLCGYLAFSKLKVRAALKQGDRLNSSNLICSVAFERDRDFFATAGVNRKIKIFECDMVLNNAHDIHYPVVEMSSRSKLSSICWNSYIKNQIASSDFEGVVQVWDVARSQIVVEMKEHSRRVWSVDYSLADPTKLASGSDDGTAKLWNINQGGSIGSIRTKANVCSVQFPPDSAQLLAIGSADHNIYCYDLRNLRIPWCTLVGHTKTVSYVKFVDSTTLVSSCTDSSLKLWDLSANTSKVLDNSLLTFTGHTNIKNFVGLSVADGYIATGSETNEVFVYHKAFPMPVMSYKFNSVDPLSGREADGAAQFISCVSWRSQSPTLVAANSVGNIKILEMV